MKLSFYSLLLVLMLICAFDVYLNLKHPVTESTELNPIGVLILRHTDLPTFISIKFICNALCFCILICYFNHNKMKGITVLTIVTIMYLALLIYMVKA